MSAKMFTLRKWSKGDVDMYRNGRFPLIPYCRVQAHRYRSLAFAAPSRQNERDADKPKEDRGSLHRNCHWNECSLRNMGVSPAPAVQSVLRIHKIDISPSDRTDHFPSCGNPVGLIAIIATAESKPPLAGR